MVTAGASSMRSVADAIFTSKESTNGHRNDIDGLRAIAVLAILGNHIGLRGLGGGYVGVDIFFVISGYLITGIIARELSHSTFSIAEFYRRRISRIFPALFAMLAIVSIFAWLSLLPGELQRYANSVWSTALFGSNIYFYSETGYFDAASHVKPLLHTWSLGVEEQFYIIWPLLLLLIKSASKRQQMIAIFGFIIASLLFSQFLLDNHPAAAFYLLPPRAFELGLGGLLALASPFHLRKWVAEILAFLGLAMLGYAVWRFFQPMAFPGFAALIPTIGTVLLIAAAPNTIIGRLLSLRPVVFIGQISYSLYLWHWPVIVFSEIWLFLSATMSVKIAQVLLSLVLATLSWRYIEIPFRTAGRINPITRVFAIGSVAIVAACILSATFLYNHGQADRFTPSQNRIASHIDTDYEAEFRRGNCFIIEPSDHFDSANCLKTKGKKPLILLLGDSMSAHLWPGLARYQDTADIAQATMAGCRPNLYPQHSKRRCEQFFRNMLIGWVVRNKPDLVLLSGNWQDEDMALLENSLPFLKKIGPVMLIGPPPQYAASLPRLMVFAERNDDPNLGENSLMPSPYAIDDQMAVAASRNSVPYISLIKLLCDGHKCMEKSSSGEPMQFDYGHFTVAGSNRVADMIWPKLLAEIGPLAKN